MSLLPTVGVITLDGSFNFGNRLQLFATMALWREPDCEPMNLRYAADVGRRPQLKSSSRPLWS